MAVPQWNDTSTPAISSEGERVLGDLHESVDDPGRSVGALLLGAVERVVIPRCLVVFEIDARGLEVDELVQVIAHRPGLTFGDEAGERTTDRGEERGRRGETEQDGDRLECGAGVRLHQAGHRIDDELQEIELNEGQSALGEDERDTREGPAGAAGPDEVHCPPCPAERRQATAPCAP